jgi:hypothetical protein
VHALDPAFGQRATDYYEPGGSDGAKGYSGQMATRFVFQPWGIHDPEERLPTFFLAVPVRDFFRLAFRRCLNPERWESLREEVRGLIAVQHGGQRPASFEVVFEIDSSEAIEFLGTIVCKVRVPKIPARSPEEMRADAALHLWSRLPGLRNIRGSLEDYMAMAVRNFYRDCLDKAKAGQERTSEVEELEADGDPLTDLLAAEALQHLEKG